MTSQCEVKIILIVLPKVLIKFLSPSLVDVHTTCLIGGTTLYFMLAFYLLWNIFFFSSSRCLSRSYGSYPLYRLSRSSRGGDRRNHNNWYLSIHIVSQQYALQETIIYSIPFSNNFSPPFLINGGKNPHASLKKFNITKVQPG